MSTNADPTTIEDLAAAIDEFSYDYDTYGYKDAYDDRETALAEITASIHSGKVVHLEDWLSGIVREKDSNSMKALKLLDCLRMQKQQGLLQQFLNSPVDSFAVFQLKNDEELHELRFSPLSYAQSDGRTVKQENYNLVYTDQLKATGPTSDILDILYYKFNIDRPDDFRGHSLSVSDVVALKQNGHVTCHYVDSIGFMELPAFLPSMVHDKSTELCFPDSESTKHASAVCIERPTRQKDAFELDR